MQSGMKVFFGGVLCLLMAGTIGTASAQPDAGEEADYVAGDPQACLGCHGANSSIAADDIMHGAHGVVGNAQSPFADGQIGCQSCHGPSADHMDMVEGERPLPAMVFDERRPAPDRDAACLGCHEQETGHYWAGSAHEFADLSCTGCHTLHEEEDAMLSFQKVNEECMDCHQRQQSEILQASSHPLRSGQMTCTDCHSPHGGPGPSELAAFTVNDQCEDCHVEKRGPYLWEHAPVTEDCTNCHTPHGSNHRSLMAARTPFLCQQCHLAAYHPSNLESGIGTPPQGASSNILGKDCMNCHTQVHGSNHPSGSRLTR